MNQYSLEHYVSRHRVTAELHPQEVIVQFYRTGERMTSNIDLISLICGLAVPLACDIAMTCLMFTLKTVQYINKIVKCEMQNIFISRVDTVSSDKTPCYRDA